MADVNPTDNTIDGSVDFSSISSILDTINGVFNVSQQPATDIPPPLLLVGKNLRPGMSARNLASRIISRLESNGGIPVGNVFGDGNNAIPIAVRVISEEIVSMLQTEAKIDIAIDPGAIRIFSTGTATPTGQVITQGSNVIYVTGGGGIQ